MTKVVLVSALALVLASIAFTYELARRDDRVAVCEPVVREPRDPRLAAIYGAAPASPGALFVRPPLAPGALDTIEDRLRELVGPRAELKRIDDDPDAPVAGIELVLPELCGELPGALAASWGPGTNSTWFDPRTHQRATFVAERCALRFDTYAEPAAWVALLPLEVVGMSREMFANRFTDHFDEYVAEWSAPGLGFGATMTTLEAANVDERIAALSVRVKTDAASADAVRVALSLRLRSEPRPDGAGGYVWQPANRPSVALRYRDGRLELRAPANASH